MSAQPTTSNSGPPGSLPVSPETLGFNWQAFQRTLDPAAAMCDNWVGGPYLNEISTRLSLPRRFISLVIVCFGLFFVLFGLGQSLLCTIVGVMYPAYQSMKALEYVAPVTLLSFTLPVHP